MGDDAQEKKIAELIFGSSKAEGTLNTINEGLKKATELAQKANKAFADIDGKLNIEISSKDFNFNSIQNKMQDG